MLWRIRKLPGDREAVHLVGLKRIRVHTARRGEEGDPELLAEALEAPAQDGQAPLVFRVESAAEVIKERLFGLVLLDVAQVIPFVGLSFPDEGYDLL